MMMDSEVSNCSKHQSIGFHHVLPNANRFHISNIKLPAFLTTSLESSKSSNVNFDFDVNDVIEKYKEELISLRGTPELVDRLENLVVKYPGIELQMSLYRLLYPFALDGFQEDGLRSLMTGNSCLVSTPTGSGKTMVGELAIYFALMLGLRVAYTTPLKALSNQKYQDFKLRYGADRVGLLTGDIAINRGASITIMTTEVFRNMIYDSDSSNQLSNLFMVCFDEFHFMNDPDRGTVWEESVISCPPSVRILALSATMGNVEEIKGWLSQVHGPTDLIISNHRPVPLRYLFAMKQGLMPLFRDPNAGPGSLNGVTRIKGKLDAGSIINPSILKMEEETYRKAQMRQGRSGRPIKDAKVNVNAMLPRYVDVGEKLKKMNLLPAIFFIFSRVGCEDSAKLLLQGGLRLLNEGEVTYVTQAISAFVAANPEIPVSKSSFQMLRAGVGVHHAGLIPVWKAFIEDLFNANKIKILFATETLAAGVNMPARTTVISTVTKRIATEIIRLKTSQLLQMAGRAGRRGKDDEGTVVILKNRFEDSRMSHKILTSPVDDIKSHFKASYGLAVKLLETRDIAACKSLIEKGFGAYLLQQRIKKKELDSKQDIEIYRSILQKYSLKVAREYFKYLRRYEKEKRNEEFLIDKLIETEMDLVMAIADYMPLGTGLLLRNDESGFFLGDVKWGNRNEFHGFGVLTRDKNLYIVQKEDIRCFTDSDKAISVAMAESLLELVSKTKEWKEVYLSSSQKHMALQSKVIIEDIKEIYLLEALDAVFTSPAIPIHPFPGSVVRQQLIVKEIYDELVKSPIYNSDDEELVVQALQYAATLKDPVAFVTSSSTTGDQRNLGEVYAWKMFQNVLKVLQETNALNGTIATDLGWMVGSLTSDNELWLAIVLRSPNIRNLSQGELAAVMSSLVVDGFKASNSFFKYPASENVQRVYDELDRLSWDLKKIQSDYSLEFPINLCREVGGLVECWYNGVSWRELCRDTSMDQGDVCRILRRTVEILRQIPLAYGIDPIIVDMAIVAANKMDRFPVAELDVQTGELKDKSGVGFSSEALAMSGLLSDELNIDKLQLENDDEDDEDDEDSNQVQSRDEIDLLSLFDDLDNSPNDSENDIKDDDLLANGLNGITQSGGELSLIADEYLKDLNENELNRKSKRTTTTTTTTTNTNSKRKSLDESNIASVVEAVIDDDNFEDLDELLGLSETSSTGSTSSNSSNSSNSSTSNRLRSNRMNSNNEINDQKKKDIAKAVSVFKEKFQFDESLSTPPSSTEMKTRPNRRNKFR